MIPHDQPSSSGDQQPSGFWVQPPQGSSPPPGFGPPSVGPVPYGQSRATDDLGLSPIVTSMTAREGTAKRRGLGRIVPVACGSALLIAGLAFGATSLAGGSSNTPEQAVQQLFTAIDKEDVLGMLESLSPGERSALVDPVRTMGKELSRLGVASDDLSLDQLRGIDFQVVGAKWRATPLSEDVAMVEAVAGSVRTVLHPGDLPIGNRLRKLIEGEGGSLSDDTAGEDEVQELTAGAGTRVMVVKTKGTWSVSLGYTGFEAVRRDNGKPLPSFGAARLPRIGASSPEGAVQGLADRFAEGDLAGMIGYLDPEEMAAAYDYVPLYLADTKEAMSKVDRAITTLQLSGKVNGTGDRRLVALVGMKVSGEAEDVKFRLKVEEDCYEAETVIQGKTETKKGCVGDTIPDYEKALEGAFDLKTLRNSGGIAVHQVDGKWYVSPTRSLLDNLNLALKAAKPDFLAKAAEMSQQFEGLFGSVFGMGDDYDDEYECDDQCEKDYNQDSESVSPSPTTLSRQTAKRTPT